VFCFCCLHLSRPESSVLEFKIFYIRTSILYFIFVKSLVLELELAVTGIRKSIRFFSLKKQLPRSCCSMSFIISRAVKKIFGFKQHH